MIAHADGSVIQVGSAHKVPLGNWMTTYVFPRRRSRLRTAKVCPNSGCQRYAIVTVIVL